MCVCKHEVYIHTVTLHPLITYLQAQSHIKSYLCTHNAINMELADPEYNCYLQVGKKLNSTSLSISLKPYFYPNVIEI